jgi:AraC family transcriptional regulator
MIPVRETTSALYREKVLRVQRYVEERLDEELEPALLAKIGCISLYHFHRVFRGVTAETVSGYVRRLRLERAARRLRVTDARVTDIALEAGFGSHEAFTRAFKEHFGANPSEYRGLSDQAHKPVPALKGVEVAWCPAIRVARLRRIGPYEGSGEAFSKLFAWAMRSAVAPAGMVLGVCLDDPDVTPAEKLRFDACLMLDSVPADDEVRSGVIPKGWYARYVYTGPYEGLPEAYTALVGGWATEQENELADEACIEIYLNDPTQVAPAELKTEIRLRLLR